MRDSRGYKNLIENREFEISNFHRCREFFSFSRNFSKMFEDGPN